MSKKINVSVEIGYELRTVELTQKEWDDVNKGEFLSKTIEDMYEGEILEYEFVFNNNQSDKVELIVTYEGESEGFRGSLDEAIIQKNNT